MNFDPSFGCAFPGRHYPGAWPTFQTLHPIQLCQQLIHDPVCHPRVVMATPTKLKWSTIRLPWYKHNLLVYQMILTYFDFLKSASSVKIHCNDKIWKYVYTYILNIWKFTLEMTNLNLPKKNQFSLCMKYWNF